MEAADGGGLGFDWHCSSSMVLGEERGEEDSDQEPSFDELEPAVRLGGAGLEQQWGSQTGGYAGNHISTLPYQAVPREQVSQEREQQIGMQTGQRNPSTAASRSVSRIQSLLRRKFPIMKQIVRSPLLKRQLISPRMGHYGAKHLRPPSAIRDGSVPLDDAAILTSCVLGQDAPRSTRKHKLRSVVWKEFEPIYQGNLIVQAKCIHCLDIFAANRENGRSACRRHLEVCKERLRMNQMVDNLSTYTLSPDALALKNWKFDQEVSREAMVNFIVLQELPFSLVEHAPFQRFVATLNPMFTIVSRTTVIEDVIRSYENQRLALKEIIRDSDSRVCFTADLWTSK